MAIDFGDNPVAPQPTSGQTQQIKNILAVNSNDIVDATSVGKDILTGSVSTIVDTLSVSQESHTHNLSSLDASGASNGQVIKFNGTQWIPSTDNNSGVWGSITGDLTTQADLSAALTTKQNVLSSGVNIKTINGNSVLGGGNLAIGGSGEWGTITGSLSNQIDLTEYLKNPSNVQADLFDRFDNKLRYYEEQEITNGDFYPEIGGNVWDISHGDISTLPFIKDGALRAHPEHLFYFSNRVTSKNGKFTIGARIVTKTTPFANMPITGSNSDTSLWTIAFNNQEILPDGNLPVGLGGKPAHNNFGRNLKHTAGTGFYQQPTPLVIGVSGDTVTTSIPHEFTTGDLIICFQNTGSTIPSGLSLSKQYYAIVVSATELRFANTRQDALNGIIVPLVTGGVNGWGVYWDYEEISTSLRDTDFLGNNLEFTLLITVDGNYITYTIPGFGYRTFYHPRLYTRVGDITYFYIEPAGEYKNPFSSTYITINSVKAIWGNSPYFDEVYNIPPTPITTRGSSSSTFENYILQKHRNYPQKSFPFSSTVISSRDFGYVNTGKFMSVGVPQEETLLFTGQPNDGGSITLPTSNALYGVKTYTFKNTLTTANDVKIGSTIEETCNNFIHALATTSGLAGIAYGIGTGVNTDYRGEYKYPNCLSIMGLFNSNSIITLTKTATNCNFLNGGTMLAATQPAFTVYYGSRSSNAVVNWQKLTTRFASTTSSPISNLPTQNMISLICPPWSNKGECVEYTLRGMLGGGSHPKVIEIAGVQGSTPSVVLSSVNTETNVPWKMSINVINENSYAHLMYCEFETPTTRIMTRATSTFYNTNTNAAPPLVVRCKTLSASDVTLESLVTNYNY